jgi:hypothetical protein
MEVEVEVEVEEAEAIVEAQQEVGQIRSLSLGKLPTYLSYAIKSSISGKTIA